MASNHFVHPLLRAHNWQHRPQLDEVCDWWRSGGQGVCALVGMGGAGKTAITERFLRMLPEGLPAMTLKWRWVTRTGKVTFQPTKKRASRNWLRLCIRFVDMCGRCGKEFNFRAAETYRLLANLRNGVLTTYPLTPITIQHDADVDAEEDNADSETEQTNDSTTEDQPMPNEPVWKWESLAGEQLEELHSAIKDSYDQGNLEQVVRFRLDENYANVVAGKTNFSDQVFALIGWAEKTGNLKRFFEACFERNPGSPKLKAIAKKANP